MIRKFISLVFFIVLLAGCYAHRTTVVLVPDPYGHVGKVAVQTQGGQEVISESGQAIIVKNAEAPPPPAVVYDERKINSVFGKALAVEPPISKKYILYFESDSTELLPDSKTFLPEVIDIIRQLNSFDISVNGHSDSTGSSEYNLELSLKRAFYIKDTLVKAGIDEKYITTTSHGEGNPLIPAEKGVAEPRNRRVEIIVR